MAEIDPSFEAANVPAPTEEELRAPEAEETPRKPVYKWHAKPKINGAADEKPAPDGGGLNQFDDPPALPADPVPEPEPAAAIDPGAIRSHIKFLHTLAIYAKVDGVLLLVRFEGEKAPLVERFTIGDHAAMAEATIGWASDPNMNLYAPWAVFRSDLEPGRKGRESDVVAVLALVGDLDADTGKAGGPLPVDPPYVIETSAGNFQPVFPLFDALAPQDAKPLAVALADAIGCDARTKDTSGVWRIAGTLNWPSKKKLERGRSAEPQPVKVSKAWDGTLVAIDALREALPKKEKAKASEQQQDQPNDVDELFESLSVSEKKVLAAPAYEGEDRNETVASFVSAMWKRGLSDAQIKALILKFPHGLGERYVTGGKDLDADLRRLREKFGEGAGAEGEQSPPGLGVCNAGNDTGPPSPRGWIYGNTFCREYLSVLLADGGIGKTTLRYAQFLSAATGRSLTGEHVFCRARVLIISLEDSLRELQRRLWATRLHYKIEPKEVDGWLFYCAPGITRGRLMTTDGRRTVVGQLVKNIKAEIERHKIDIVAIDPFVKSHSVQENDNSLIDEVVQIITDLTVEYNIAFDASHHTAKGAPDPGNADRGRGASALKDAGRLVTTLTQMSSEEAALYSIPEPERKQYIRLDNGKVNIIKGGGNPKWFRLIGVRLGNPTEMYPNGDEVQTVEQWTPPKLWADVTDDMINRALTDIDAGLSDGNRYSASPKASKRAAWPIVAKHTSKTEVQARKIIREWLKSGLLTEKGYENPETRKEVLGLYVDNAKRPGTATTEKWDGGFLSVNFGSIE